MPRLPHGANWIAAGAIAALLLPSLAIGAGVPFVLACAASALAGTGVILLLAPRKPFERLDASGAARGRIEFARELLTEAEPLVARLERAARIIHAQKVGERVRHLASVAQRILEAVEKDPLRIDRVRRFLTYYLPRTAEIAEAYGSLEQSPSPDPSRLSAASALLDRLDAAFTRYAGNLQSADLDKLDIELKLLKSSLDEDLGPSGPPSPAVPSAPADGSKGRA